MSLGQEIVIPVGQATTPAFAAVPPRPTRGIVVLHEVLGRAPEMDRVVERFAARGYAAVCPVLFRYAFTPRCIRQAVQLMRTGGGPFADQVRAARTWLCARAGLSERQVG